MATHQGSVYFSHKGTLVKYLVPANLVLGLLACGCGDTRNMETGKAVAQIEAKAPNAATKAIKNLKTDAVTRLQKVPCGPETREFATA
jgi:hypothetical protein